MYLFLSVNFHVFVSEEPLENKMMLLKEKKWMDYFLLISLNSIFTWPDPVLVGGGRSGVALALHTQRSAEEELVL